MRVTMSQLREELLLPPAAAGHGHRGAAAGAGAGDVAADEEEGDVADLPCGPALREEEEEEEDEEDDARRTKRKQVRTQQRTRVQMSPSCPPHHLTKDTFLPIPSPWGHRGRFPPPHIQGQRPGPPKSAMTPGSSSHHGQEGALPEARLEGDELGLRVPLAAQEPAARERTNRGHGTARRCGVTCGDTKAFGDAPGEGGARQSVSRRITDKTDKTQLVLG